MKSPTPKNKIMTAQEVSGFLKIPLSTIYALAAQGKIRAVKFGRHWRFVEEDIHQYLYGKSSATESERRGRDRRQSPRTETHIPVQLTAAEGSLKEGRIRNLSRTGALFEGGQALKTEWGIGESIRLTFPSSDKIEGRIVHQSLNGDLRIGIQFQNLSKQEEEVLRRYVS